VATDFVLLCNKQYSILDTNKSTIKFRFKQEPVELVDALLIGFGHRQKYLLYFQSYVPEKIQSAIIPNLGESYSSLHCSFTQ
jgi:hypothetical protein